jgi:predicted nucleic acid-binding protein
MKKIFLDANVIIDFLNKSSLYHQEAKETLTIIRKHYGKPFISTTTFAMAYYTFGKFISKKPGLNKIIKAIFSQFEFTTENHRIMNEVLGSKFPDLEDALQYFSAVSLPVDLIITRDVHGYYLSEIPVLLPAEFIELYYNT